MSLRNRAAAAGRSRWWNRRGGIARAGFSLIELMVVVAIVGILASIAVPTFARYLRKSRSVEAVESLDKMAAGARVYHTQHQSWPGPAGPAPNIAGSPSASLLKACQAHGGYFEKSELADPTNGFENDAWRSLLFRPGDNSRYVYEWAHNGKTDASGEGYGYASGDLDCDGNLSVWWVLLKRESAFGPLNRIGPYIIVGSEDE